LKTAGGNNNTHENLLAYGWRAEGKSHRLMVVNLTGARSVARLPLGFWSEVAGQQWILHDVDDGSTYERDGNEMTGHGLFIDLKPYESHIFRFERK
jgi:hypothetical protein